MTDGFSPPTHGWFLNRGCSKCKAKDRRIEALEDDRAESRRWRNLTRLKELEKLYDVAVADRVRMHTENEKLRAVARHAQVLLDGGGDEAVYHLRKALQEIDDDLL